MIHTIAIIALCLLVGGFMFMVWGLCAAAKRGDQMDEECNRPECRS